MSLVVRPDDLSAGGLLALNVLGALSVAESIETLGGEPQIKWPNDVLLAGRKVAGVLVEAAWQETRLEYAVIGTGVNVLPGSVPPDREVAFPATSVAGVLGSPVDRGELLLRILGSLDRWLDALGSPALLEAWQRRLAYLGGQIVIEGPVGEERGVLAGISAAGGLVLEGTDGQRRSLGAGYHSLRPVDSGWE
jgi:BirA family biotin operon repressor/biotin-[acetyl-CoA-carboxylase] ligase